MASITQEIIIDAPPEHAWDALKDPAALHTKLAPGFVTDTRLEGDSRIVTFGNGATARELLVEIDHDNRRIVWSVQGAPFKHHNASAQVFSHANNATRFVWIADFLPNEIAEHIEGLIRQGLATIKQTLEASALLER